jgi:hypothetical protein
VQGVGDCISCCEYYLVLYLLPEDVHLGREKLTISYNMIKKQMQGGDPSYRTSSGQHLLAAAEASESAANDSKIKLTHRCHYGHADESYMGCQD